MNFPNEQFPELVSCTLSGSDGDMRIAIPKKDLNSGTLRAGLERVNEGRPGLGRAVLLLVPGEHDPIGVRDNFVEGGEWPDSMSVTFVRRGEER